MFVIGPRPLRTERSISLFRRPSHTFKILLSLSELISNLRIFLQNRSMNPVVQLSLIFFFVSTVAALNSTEKSPPYCVFHKNCYKDSECGPRGRCVGHLVGKCNCEACVNDRTCTNDYGCGRFLLLYILIFVFLYINS